MINVNWFKRIVFFIHQVTTIALRQYSTSSTPATSTAGLSTIEVATATTGRLPRTITTTLTT